VPDAPESLLRRLGISEAVALAGLTALGYCYAFAYEAGYLSHFGIPFWVIHLSLVHVLIVVGVFASVVSLLILLFQVLPGGPWWALLIHLSIVVGVGGITVLFLWILDWHNTWELVLGIVFGVPGALVTLGYINSRLILPIFLYKDKGSWLDRWAFVLRREWARSKPNLLDDTVATMDKAGLRVSVWLGPVWMLFIFTPLAVRFAGLAAANVKGEYVVVAGEPECVAIRTYGDYVVCSLIDRKSRRVLPAFRLIHVGDSTARVYRIELLGHLRAPEVAATTAPMSVPKAVPTARPSVPKMPPTASSSVPKIAR